MGDSLLNLLNLTGDSLAHQANGSDSHALKHKVRSEIFKVMNSISLSDLLVKKEKIIEIVNDNISQKIKEKEELCKLMAGQTKNSDFEIALIKCKSRLLFMERTIDDLRNRIASLETKKPTANKSTQVSFSKKYLEKLAEGSLSKNNNNNNNYNCCRKAHSKTKAATCKGYYPVGYVDNKSVNKCHYSKAKSTHTQCKEQRLISPDGKPFMAPRSKGTKSVKRPSNKCVAHTLEYLKNKREHKPQVKPNPPCERCKKKEIAVAKARASTLRRQNYTYDNDLKLFFFNQKKTAYGGSSETDF